MKKGRWSVESEKAYLAERLTWQRAYSDALKTEYERRAADADMARRKIEAVAKRRETAEKCAADERTEIAAEMEDESCTTEDGRLDARIRAIGKEVRHAREAGVGEIEIAKCVSAEKKGMLAEEQDAADKANARRISAAENLKEKRDKVGKARREALTRSASGRRPREIACDQQDALQAKQQEEGGAGVGQTATVNSNNTISMTVTVDGGRLTGAKSGTPGWWNCRRGWLPARFVRGMGSGSSPGAQFGSSSNSRVKHRFGPSYDSRASSRMSRPIRAWCRKGGSTPEMKGIGWIPETLQCPYCLMFPPPSRSCSPTS